MTTNTTSCQQQL
jgi:hypothetical protein